MANATDAILTTYGPDTKHGDLFRPTARLQCAECSNLAPESITFVWYVNGPPALPGPDAAQALRAYEVGDKRRGWTISDTKRGLALCPDHRGLPADPDGQNDDRAAWADRAIQSFIKETGADFETALGDLICNLAHWADRHPTSDAFEDALDRARALYAAETNPAGGI